MYGGESWTMKKAEHRCIDAFELWCWRRLLRVPWTARRSNQSILKEISPGCSLEGLMLNWNSSIWATWCEELTHLKKPWCWERLRQEEKGTIEDEMVGWHHWLNGHEFGWTLGVGDGQGGLLQFMESQSVRHDCWTKLNWITVQILWCEVWEKLSSWWL